MERFGASCRDDPCGSANSSNLRFASLTECFNTFTKGLHTCIYYSPFRFDCRKKLFLYVVVIIINYYYYYYLLLL